MRSLLIVFVMGMVSRLLIFSSVAQLSIETPNGIERRAAIAVRAVGEIRILSGGGLLFADSGVGVILTNDWRIVWPRISSPLRFPLGVEPDGRFVCVGDTNHCIFRINLDRTLDSSFQSPAVSLDDISLLTDVQSQPDGKIVVGCGVPYGRPPSMYPGINKGVFRLNTDGSDDSTFQPPSPSPASLPATVYNLIMLPDGKILANFGRSIQRFLTNGAPDPTFHIPAVEQNVDRMAVQPDGKIVLAGSFSKINGMPRSGLARLNTDGTVDFSFNPSAVAFPAVGVKIQLDGGILVNSGVYVHRWFSDGQQDPSFSVRQNGGTITGMTIDGLDHVYVGDDQYLTKLSGRTRVIAPPANVPVVLERSAIIDGGWAAVKTVPANEPVDQIIDADFPGIGNTFYRTRPAQ